MKAPDLTAPHPQLGAPLLHKAAVCHREQGSQAKPQSPSPCCQCGLTWMSQNNAPADILDNYVICRQILASSYFL